MFDLYFSFVSFEPKDATSTSASYRLHNYVYCINLNTLEVLPPNKHCLWLSAANGVEKLISAALE